MIHLYSIRGMACESSTEGYLDSPLVPLMNSNPSQSIEYSQERQESGACPCATRGTSIYKGLATLPYKNVAVTANEMREGLSVSVCRHWHQTLCKLLQSETKSQCRTVLATSNAITCLWHCGMRHRGGRTVMLKCL